MSAETPWRGTGSHTGAGVLRAQVAILCNHQRAVPKGHSGQMQKMGDKLLRAQQELDDLQAELKAALKGDAKWRSRSRMEPVKVGLFWTVAVLPLSSRSRMEAVKMGLFWTVAVLPLSSCSRMEPIKVGLFWTVAMLPLRWADAEHITLAPGTSASTPAWEAELTLLACKHTSICAG